MIKKLIKQLIPACFLFLGVFTSCTSEGESDSPAALPGISLRLQISAGNTRSSVGTGTEAEKHIDNVHFWFFAEGALDTDKALLYKSETVSSNDDELVLKYTDEVLRLYNMNSEGSYQLFVIANLPADATINGETRLDDLKEYSYTSVNRPGSPFIMTGSSVGVHDFANNSQISIPLLRVASGLDITVKNATGENWIINKISIAGDQKSVLLFSLASGTASPASNTFGTSLDVMTTPTTNDEVTCSGYINENLSTDAVKVVVEGSVNGTARTWTAELQPNGKTMLPRNTICGVTLNLKEKVITVIDIEYTILDSWTDKELAPMNSETYLELDQQVLQLSSTIDATLHISTNAATIQVDMTHADGFFLDGYTDDNIEITPIDGLAELLFREDASLIIPPTSGTVTITAGGITKTISLSYKESAAKFLIKSVSVNGHIITEGAVLPPTFGLSSSISEANITIITENNIAWQYRIVQYVGTYGANPDNKLWDSDWIHMAYDGVSGEHTNDILIFPNSPAYSDIVTCRLEIGIYGKNVGYKILEYNFTISK